MYKVSNVLEVIIKIFIGILLIILVANVFLQILSRQVFKFPTVWTDEVARFSFIWITMLGASLQIKNKAHYAVEILIESSFFKNYAKIVHLISYLLMFVFSVFFFKYGLNFSIMGLNRYSTAANIRMIWIYSAMPTGGFLMCFFLIELFIKDFGKKTINTKKDGI